MPTDALSMGAESSPGIDQSALLLLADGRFPSGGHAHSAGVEAAAALEGVCDVESLAEFVRGRLVTTGAVAAAFAATACAAAANADWLTVLDDEFAARTPSPALRKASLRLGRQILRAGRAVWPGPALDALAGADGNGPHQPIGLGAVAAAAGLGPAGAAWASAHDAVLTPATAAVRLLGLDPYAVHGLVARFGPDIAAVAEQAAGHAQSAPEDLPASAGPLLDISAERHATWEVRLFAS